MRIWGEEFNLESLARCGRISPSMLVIPGLLTSATNSPECFPFPTPIRFQYFYCLACPRFLLGLVKPLGRATRMRDMLFTPLEVASPRSKDSRQRRERDFYGVYPWQASCALDSFNILDDDSFWHSRHLIGGVIMTIWILFVFCICAAIESRPKNQYLSIHIVLYIYFSYCLPWLILYFLPQFLVSKGDAFCFSNDLSQSLISAKLRIANGLKFGKKFGFY